MTATPEPLDPDVRALIEATNIAHLATVRADGGPHVVPVWIGLDAERIVFLTDPASAKGRNIARDPRVALSIAAADAPNTMAHVRGRVVETRDDTEGWRIIDALAQKYLGQPYPLRTDRAAYVVAVDRAFALSF